MPCHVKALEVGSPGENLLRLMPGLVVDRTENSCSGMAGTFGLKRENYRASLRAGRALIGSLRSPRLQAGTTECSACKIQMEQGAGKPTIHPVKLLALAYGLMPEVAELLVGPGRGIGGHVKVRRATVRRGPRNWPAQNRSSSSCPTARPSANCAIALASEYPQLAPLLPHVLFAVGSEYVRDDSHSPAASGVYPSGQRRIE